jgi:hypothetical protein
VWFYLLSCPHGNSLGCFVLPTGYMMADLGWDEETVSKHVRELVSNGFIERDERSFLTVIIGWWGHNTIENGNVAKGAVKAIKALPRCELLSRFLKDLNVFPNVFPNVLANELRNEFPNGIPNGIETKKPEPEPEPEPKHSVGADAPDEHFEEFWKAYPSRRDSPNPKKPARQKFNAAVKGGVDPQAIIAAARSYAETCRRKGTEPQYVAQAQTWLNQERWKQEQSGNSAPQDDLPEYLKPYPPPQNASDADMRQWLGSLPDEVRRKHMIESRKWGNA